MEWEEKGISKTHRSELFDNGGCFRTFLLLFVYSVIQSCQSRIGKPVETIQSQHSIYQSCSTIGCKDDVTNFSLEHFTLDCLV